MQKLVIVANEAIETLQHIWQTTTKAAVGEKQVH